MNDPTPRPAHIEPSECARIELEGRALRIDMPDQASAWLPLTRLSRLTLSNRAQMSTSAILACARNGITIILHDAEQQTIARIVGHGAHHTGLRQRLMDLTEQPDWQERYADWRLAMRRRISLTVARRLQAPPHYAHKPHRLRAWLHQQAVQYTDVPSAAFTRRIYQRQSIAWAQQTLMELGIDASAETWLIGDPDLANDLGRMIALRMEPARLGWLRSIARRGGIRRPLAQKEVIRKTEQLRPRMDRISLDLINRLQIWLGEIA